MTKRLSSPSDSDANRVESNAHLMKLAAQIKRMQKMQPGSYTTCDKTCAFIDKAIARIEELETRCDELEREISHMFLILGERTDQYFAQRKRVEELEAAQPVTVTDEMAERAVIICFGHNPGGLSVSVMKEAIKAALTAKAQEG